MERAKPMKLWRNLNWRVQVIISVFLAVTLIIALLFGVSYHYVWDKMESANEKIANLSFREAEKELKEMMVDGEQALHKFSNKNFVWDFVEDNYQSDLEKSIADQNIVKYLDELLSVHSDIFALALVNRNGRVITSTASQSSRSGFSEIAENIEGWLIKSQKEYPYVNWIDGGSIELSVQDPLYLLADRSSLIGVKALGEADANQRDSFLLVSIEEEQVKKSYEQLAYNESQVVLLNEEKQIISSTDHELVGTLFKPEDQNQNIEYDLSYDGWQLVNMIAKENYALESKDIRHFGMVAGIVALLCVLLIFILWSRKYIKPIQNLMEQMERVGREQLDIKKPERAGWLELDHLNEEFYHTVQKLKGYIQKLQELEQEKAKEELLVLQYQINPHFLYNSLNSIRWMAMMTNNNKVADSLVILSKIIQPILRDPSFTWKLKNELEFIKNYVDMMRIRFGGFIEFCLRCPSKWEDETFPRFILQPVIENCFVHGDSSADMQSIDLDIDQADGFVITVKNSAGNLKKEDAKRINDSLQNGEREGTSIGLFNVQKRLRLLYGEKGRIWIERDGDTGVAVYITF